jgi:hypothetical protein
MLTGKQIAEANLTATTRGSVWDGLERPLGW